MSKCMCPRCIARRSKAKAKRRASPRKLAENLYNGICYCQGCQRLRMKNRLEDYSAGGRRPPRPPPAPLAPEPREVRSGGEPGLLSKLWNLIRGKK